MGQSSPITTYTFLTCIEFLFLLLCYFQFLVHLGPFYKNCKEEYE
jgi:hypothetical protein